MPCDFTFAASRAAAFNPAFGQLNVMASRSLKPAAAGAALSARFCAMDTEADIATAMAVMTGMFFMAMSFSWLRGRTGRPCY